jgi:hypothetical protein
VLRQLSPVADMGRTRSGRQWATTGLLHRSNIDDDYHARPSDEHLHSRIARHAVAA